MATFQGWEPLGRGNLNLRNRPDPFSWSLDSEGSDESWYFADIMAVSVVKILKCLWVKYCWSPLNDHTPGTMGSALRIPFLPHDPWAKGFIAKARASKMHSGWLLPFPYWLLWWQMLLSCPTILSHDVEVSHGELNFDGQQHITPLKTLGCIKIPSLLIHVTFDELFQML